MRNEGFVASIERRDTGQFRLALNPALFEMLNVTSDPHLSMACPIFATMAEEVVQRPDQLKAELNALAEEVGVELPEEYIENTLEYLGATADHVDDRVEVDSRPDEKSIAVLIDAVQAKAFLEDTRGIYWMLRSEIRSILKPLVEAEVFTPEDIEKINTALLIERMSYTDEMFAKPEGLPN